uniref:Rhodanese domain-containing protein n=1 Tax=Picocystis salinarum TaxID=88271 RepID=A0A7S3UD24_9CHLO
MATSTQTTHHVLHGGWTKKREKRQATWSARKRTSSRNVKVMVEAWAGQKSLQRLRMKELMQTLEDARVRPIAPMNAREAHGNDRCVLVDVRPWEEYRGGWAQGAHNVPLFRRIQGWEPDKVARRAAFLAFGVLQGTEENPEFLKQAEEAIQNTEGISTVNNTEKEVVLMCLGGTWPRLDATMDTSVKNGKITRSLQAAYTLVEAGFERVRVLDGGVRAWYEAGLDMECEEAWSDEWNIES